MVRLADSSWTQIEPLLPLPPHEPRGGRRWASQRAVVDGILWVLKAGAGSPRRGHGDGSAPSQLLDKMVRVALMFLTFGQIYV